MRLLNRLAFSAALLCPVECGAADLPYQRYGNIFVVRLGDGSAELEWISSSSFRFCRRWTPPPAHRNPIQQEAVPVEIKVAAGELRFSVKHLRVALTRESSTLKVYDAGGSLLLADAAPPQRRVGGILWQRATRPTERFAGLGVEGFTEREFRPHTTVSTHTPFLVSSLGYGEYFRPAGRYVYTFDSQRRVEVPDSDTAEFYFYYGPTPKEILEEHLVVIGSLKRLDWGDFRSTSRLPAGAVLLPPAKPTWDGLRQVLQGTLRASYSAILLPAADATLYGEAPEEIRRRAFQLAAYLPVVVAPDLSGVADRMWLLRQRRRLAPYLVSYAHEARERGFPLVRPLAMQYPKDPEAARHEDEFCLGDELLVAPVLGPEARRRVYLPMGFWTELNTNRRYPGRQAVEVEAGPDWIPVFVKNGSILPLASPEVGEPMALHYFPRLAAEFFLYEEGTAELTQLHAAPAGDLLRLEIEPAADRTYEWVVHHVARCRQLTAGDTQYREAALRAELRPGYWWHDAERGNLHIRTRAKAGVFQVLHIGF